MFHWTPTHQFSKSFRNILHLIPGLVIGRGGFAPPSPPVPLVVRLGAAGPLHLGRESEVLSLAVNAILAALKKYADASANFRFHQRMFSLDSTTTPAQLRIICQLASGFDRMAASLGLHSGYKLHVVLPGSRAGFKRDIQRNLGDESWAATSVLEAGHGRSALGGDSILLSGKAASTEQQKRQVLSALSKFDQLVDAADRVLELDRNDESSDESEFTLDDYAQAGSVILDHSDLVLVVVGKDDKPVALGSTRWIEQRAEAKELTVIRVPVERPFDALLIWTAGGRRESRRLFEGDYRQADPLLFAAALDDQLLGPDFDLSKIQLGRLEQRTISQLDLEYNAKEWDRRWTLPSSNSLARHDLGRSREQIDNDFKAAKIWADHRASAMAELVRGSFIIGTLLGVVAVGGALTRVLAPHLGEAGELVEIGCLFVILWLIRRSRHYDWRSQWLSLRQLDRFIEQAAWLELLGRGGIYAPPSHLAQFQTDDIAAWTNAYFRAVVRNSSFPTAHFAEGYLKTVHMLALQNLVVNQISYFRGSDGDQGEVRFQEKSDEFLRHLTNLCVYTALAVTVAYVLLTGSTHLLPKFVYLFPHWVDLAQRVQTWVEYLISKFAMDVPVLAALSTSAAAAFSAMRYHGEYAQIAARYEGVCNELQAIQNQLAMRLPDRRSDFSAPPLRSAYLASIIQRATAVLIQEVQGWRAILQKKEIEPT